jgi:hypothetical protein
MSDNLQAILEKQTAILERLAAANGGGETDNQKQLANFSTYNPLHGPNGLFSSPGLEREVITAHVRPIGLSDLLPKIPTVFTHPLFGAVTGFTKPTGSQPDNSCEDAPKGHMKAAKLTARLGRMRFDSNTIDMDDVMLRLHRGDFTDLQLRGRVLGLQNLAPSGMDEGQILNLVTASEMVTMGVQFELERTRQLWQGTVAVPHEFPGLDAQIATGQVDAETGNTVPALDSDVKNFAYDHIDGNGRSIVEYLSMLDWYLSYNAMTMGLDPVEHVVVMRPELWFELSSVWPCQYNTNRCATAVVGDQSRVVIDGRENVSERDAMRQGMYLDINGKRRRVVLDVGIFEHNNANNANLNPGEYASSIYLVPITILGNMPATYIEYLDYRQAARDVSFGQGHLPVWWTDNGLFSWSVVYKRWCYSFSLKTEQRVILRAPHLAGKIDAVKYTPLQHLRDPYPDSPYHHDGGVSLGPNPPSYSAVWG